MPAAQTIAHIVGIVVMSTNLSANHHLQAVVPFVPGPHPEQHTAFIAFDKADYKDSRGWTVADLKPVSGMQWVPLDGVRVEISVDGTGNTRFTEPGPLALPRISTDCCGRRDMLREFRPPEHGMPKPKNSDAAIIDFPKSQLAEACNTGSGRVDTLVTMPAGSRVRIEAGPKKSLILRAGATFYIANLPSTFIAGQQPAQHIMIDPLAHYLAYYHMLQPGTCQTWRLCAPRTAVKDCSANFTMRGVVEPPFEQAMRFLDINCSDSQYP